MRLDIVVTDISPFVIKQPINNTAENIPENKKIELSNDGGFCGKRCVLSNVRKPINVNTKTNTPKGIRI
tara:strand:- start:35 stop:241 length:207 start_codon:yes stop_codon:yes gene_type:complete